MIKPKLRIVAACLATSFISTANLIHAATMADIGVSASTRNYINTMQFAPNAKPPHFQRILDRVNRSEPAPTNAIRITNAAGLNNLQSGNIYFIDGNITVTQNIQVPSNVNIFVRGSITKNGNGNSESHDDTIFDVNNAQRVRLIGVNNPRIGSNGRSNGFKVRGNSSDVFITGFFIENTWEAINCRFGTSNIRVQDCYIRKTTRRAVWFLGVTDGLAGRLFIEDAGWDAFDFDAFVLRCTAFECFAIGSGRWNGFVEEGAQDSYFIRCIGVMRANSNGPGNFQLGWASNGTSQGFWDKNQPRITKDNFFVDCVSIEPSQYTGRGNGNYFYKNGSTAPRGNHFFWGCKAFGCLTAEGQANVEWLSNIPSSVAPRINQLTSTFNQTGVSNPTGSGGNGGAPINQTVTFKASGNNDYVASDRNLDAVNWPLAANRPSVGGSWERFKIMDAGGGKISITATGNNKFVSADMFLDSVNWRLAANRTAVGGWEKFTWISNSDGTVSLRANGNNRFVASDRNLSVANWPLAANRDNIGAWEKFTVQNQ